MAGAALQPKNPLEAAGVGAGVGTSARVGAGVATIGVGGRLGAAGVGAVGVGAGVTAGDGVAGRGVTVGAVAGVAAGRGGAPTLARHWTSSLSVSSP